MRKDAQNLCLLSTLSLVLCIISIDLVQSDSEVDDVFCNKCTDPDGKSCNDVIRRVANSKFWIMKGNKKGTFQDAQDTCQSLGFGIAEINSEAEQIVFRKLATSDDRYWIGFVRQQGDNEWTKTDATPLQWQPGAVEEDVEVDEGGMRAIAVDTPGVWYSSSVDDRNLIVCQFAPSSPCFRGNVEKPEPKTPSKAVSSDMDCPEPKFERNQMLRTGPNSKFLYPKSPFSTSAKKASALCEELGLETAIIDGKSEYKHLVQFAFDMRFNNTRYGFKMNIGAINTAYGIYINPSRKPPKNRIYFQAFNLRDKQYFREDGNCLGLEFVRSEFYYAPIHCERKEEVMPLCQYKSELQCSTSTPMVIDDGDSKMDKMVKVGDTDTHAYYGSLRQKPWHEASQACMSNNLKLLSFPLGQSLKIREVFKLVSKYMDTTGVKPWDGIAWTSGRFRNRQEVVFESGDQQVLWNINESQDDLELNDYLTLDKTKESCLVITADGLRPVVCEMPNYFMCYAPREIPTTTESTNDTDTNTDIRGENSTTTDIKCGNGTLLITFPPGGLTPVDIIGLIKSSISRNFSEGLSSNLDVKEESKWRISHVQAMGEITKLLCPTEHVRPKFIHLIQNYIMIYYNSKPELNQTTSHTIFWSKMLTKYKAAKDKIVPLPLVTTGGLITDFNGEDRTGGIKITNEKADNFPALDYVLEGIWYMFQITASSCYKTQPQQKLRWLADYLFHFRKFFTSQHRKWWVNPGDTNYGLLFGDMDLYESLYNLRACAVAAYQEMDIEDLLFVRPVDLEDRQYFAKNLNERT